MKIYEVTLFSNSPKEIDNKTSIKIFSKFSDAAMCLMQHYQDNFMLYDTEEERKICFKQLEEYKYIQNVGIIKTIKRNHLKIKSNIKRSFKITYSVNVEAFNEEAAIELARYQIGNNIQNIEFSCKEI